jgi:hypothetical protein
LEPDGELDEAGSGFAKRRRVEQVIALRPTGRLVGFRLTRG